MLALHYLHLEMGFERGNWRCGTLGGCMHEENALHDVTALSYSASLLTSHHKKSSCNHTCYLERDMQQQRVPNQKLCLQTAGARGHNIVTAAAATMQPYALRQEGNLVQYDPL